MNIHARITRVHQRSRNDTNDTDAWHALGVALAALDDRADA